MKLFRRFRNLESYSKTGGRESGKKFIIEGFPAGAGSPTSLRFHASKRAARRRFYIFMAGESWRGRRGRRVKAFHVPKFLAGKAQ